MENETLPRGDKVSLSDIHIEPEIHGAWANAWIWVEVDNHTLEEQQVAATIIIKLGEDQEKIEVVELIDPQGGVIEAVIRIEEPERWWPSGLGGQTLYTCLVGLSVEGDVQDVAQRRFGVREVSLFGGDSPTAILINGKEIALDPGIWAPDDQFVEKASSERYAKLVTEVVEVGALMIKAWGEGNEIDSAFYDACDELGLMVWQELMADSAGSSSEAFAGLVAEHVARTVRNLRNHPSIVVWCGSSVSSEDSDMNRFAQIIPGVVASLDPTLLYVSRCPKIG